MKVQLNKESLGINGLSMEVIYRVLAIEFHSVSEPPNTFTINFRILSDHGTPGLFNSQSIEILDPTIDPDFTFRKGTSGNMELGPSVINFQGYWESFFNGDPTSRELFKNRFPELADKVF